MLYLASPYSDPDPAVREERFVAVCRKAAELFRAGFHVFCPIAHTHPIAVHGGLATDFAGWSRYDSEMLGKCIRLVVLRLPGWEGSVGVSAEIALAREWGMPVEFVDP